MPLLQGVLRQNGDGLDFGFFVLVLAFALILIAIVFHCIWVKAQELLVVLLQILVELGVLLRKLGQLLQVVDALVIICAES